MVTASKMNRLPSHVPVPYYSTRRKPSAQPCPMCARSGWKVRSSICISMLPHAGTLNYCTTRKAEMSIRSPVSWTRRSHPWVGVCYAAGLPNPYVTGKVCRCVTTVLLPCWKPVFMNNYVTYSAAWVISSGFLPGSHWVRQDHVTWPHYARRLRWYRRSKQPSPRHNVKCLYKPVRRLHACHRYTNC